MAVAFRATLTERLFSYGFMLDVWFGILFYVSLSVNISRIYRVVVVDLYSIFISEQTGRTECEVTTAASHIDRTDL